MLKKISPPFIKSRVLIPSALVVLALTLTGCLSGDDEGGGFPDVSFYLDGLNQWFSGGKGGDDSFLKQIFEADDALNETKVQLEMAAAESSDPVSSVAYNYTAPVSLSNGGSYTYQQDTATRRESVPQICVRKSDGTYFSNTYGGIGECGVDPTGYVQSSTVSIDEATPGDGNGSILGSIKTTFIDDSGTTHSLNQHLYLHDSARVRGISVQDSNGNTSNTGGDSIGQCIGGTWYLPSCGGAENDTLRFSGGDSGALTIHRVDCNYYCSGADYQAQYQISGNTISVQYSGAQVCGQDATPPSNQNQTVSCSGDVLTINGTNLTRH